MKLATTDLSNRDKLVPSHDVMRQFFRGTDAEFWEGLERVTSSVLPIRSVHDKWRIKLKPGVTYETLGSDLATLYHLQLLVRLLHCSRVLEVGTYIGVSTLFLAEAIDPRGRVTTVEIGEEFADIARENILANGMSDRVEVICADINDLLPLFERRADWFNLIFLDGNKQNYGRLLRPLFDLLDEGGLLFVDNIFLHGDVLNAEPSTAHGRGVRELLDEAAKLTECAKVILPCGDGHLLILKCGR